MTFKKFTKLGTDLKRSDRDFKSDLMKSVLQV